MAKFVKGQSGNPHGRPKGIPDRRSHARDLFEARRNDLIGKAIDLALDGDVVALRLCLDRVVPSLKPAGSSVTLPKLPNDLAGQGRLLIDQVSRGTLTPDEAATTMSALAQLARITEVSDLERRILALEEQSDQLEKIDTAD
jgi:hypothetical protein